MVNIYARYSVLTEKTLFTKIEAVMKLTVLGSGTSHGVPVISCRCRVCKSADSRDRRLRASALLTVDDSGTGRNFLIDVGPDFREQALRVDLCSLDGVFLTHPHADHIHGIDDLRIFSRKNSCAMNSDAELAKRFPETSGKGLPVYMSSESEKLVRENFKYIFMTHEKGGGTPKLDIVCTDSYDEKNPLKISGMSVVPVPLVNGCMNTTGWIFIEEKNEEKHCIAYLTDCNAITENSLERIRACSAGGVIDHLVIDALRLRPHSTHNSFDQALAYADKIGAVHTWFTHLSHDYTHEEIGALLESKILEHENLRKIAAGGGSVEPAFDGLELSC